MTTVAVDPKKDEKAVVALHHAVDDGVTIAGKITAVSEDGKKIKVALKVTNDPTIPTLQFVELDVDEELVTVVVEPMKAAEKK
jgi:hypothetical protein